MSWPFSIMRADANGSGDFGETALMNAARYNFPQVAEVLLEHGAEVNSRDCTDNTGQLHGSEKLFRARFGDAHRARSRCELD